jgi:NADPH-dependent curcumin reductase CurA
VTISRGSSVRLQSPHKLLLLPSHVSEAFQHYVIVQDAKKFEVLKNEEKLPWSVYVGVLGMPGLTAYIGWKEYSSAKKGEVAFVTAGAGWPRFILDERVAQY